MGIFSAKGTEVKPSEIISDEEQIEINERPRICCIDIDEKSTNLLERNGFNIYSGTLGSKVDVPNTKRQESHQLLLYYDLPSNLHEFDIIILDLASGTKNPYRIEDHVRKNHTGKSAVVILSSYPETVFDPKPLSSRILHEQLSLIGKRPHIIIAFTVGAYDIEYETIKITEAYHNRQGIEKYNIYSFAGQAPLSAPKQGKEMEVAVAREDLKKLLEAHLKKATYNQIFYHPTVWAENKEKPNSKFTPLIKKIQMVI